MGVLSELRGEVAATLVQAGVANVVTDPRNAVPPCVLVDIPTTVTAAAQGVLTAVLPVRVVAPPPGNEQAAWWLLDTLEKVLQALRPMAAREATVDNVDIAGKDCPAYTVTVTRSLSLCP